MIALNRKQVNTPKYWDERYRTGVEEMWSIWTTGDLIEKVAAHIRQGATVLDVGCGAGIVPARINAIRPDIKWSGCDFSAQAVAYCRSLSLQWEQLFLGDVNAGFDVPWAWDCVLSTEVLEHVDNPRLAVREMARHTADKLIVSVPNRNAIDSHEHIWSYSEESLRDLLSGYGETSIETARGGLNLIAVCKLSS